MTTRSLKTDVYINSRTLGPLHLAKGTLETDLPRALLDERVAALVETVRHMEDTADPLLGDHLWVIS